MSARKRRYTILHQRSEGPFSFMTLCGVKAVNASVAENAEKFRQALDRSVVGTPVPVGAVVRCVNCTRIARPG